LSVGGWIRIADAHLPTAVDSFHSFVRGGEAVFGQVHRSYHRLPAVSASETDRLNGDSRAVAVKHVVVAVAFVARDGGEQSGDGRSGRKPIGRFYRVSIDTTEMAPRTDDGQRQTALRRLPARCIPATVRTSVCGQFGPHLTDGFLRARRTR